jgi:aspartyl aminopeptidase
MSAPPTEPLVQELLDYLNEGWTAFHAVAATRRALIADGYVELSERDSWRFALPWLLFALHCSHFTVCPSWCGLRTPLLLARSLRRGGKYFFTRNLSSLVAFAVGTLGSSPEHPNGGLVNRMMALVAGGAVEPGAGFTIIGAHTDSPCPKLKPISKLAKGGFLQVSVAGYGSPCPSASSLSQRPHPNSAALTLHPAQVAGFGTLGSTAISQWRGG